MQELKRKWLLSIIASTVLKAVTVIAGLFILGVAGGIAEGTLPIVIPLISIVGAYAIARECVYAVAELEDTTREIEKAMSRHRIFVRRLKRKLELMQIASSAIVKQRQSEE